MPHGPAKDRRARPILTARYEERQGHAPGKWAGYPCLRSSVSDSSSVGLGGVAHNPSDSTVRYTVVAEALDQARKQADQVESLFTDAPSV
ncbi:MULTISPECIES: hypothetical protein [unclassified Streptomyces]|uniref:hypothetical protein n=1 Tax=unclassified Streptomyces TaxID=2593676 RepID=UPI0038165BC6